MNSQKRTILTYTSLLAMTISLQADDNIPSFIPKLPGEELATPEEPTEAEAEQNASVMPNDPSAEDEEPTEETPEEEKAPLLNFLGQPMPQQ